MDGKLHDLALLAISLGRDEAVRRVVERLHHEVLVLESRVEELESILAEMYQKTHCSFEQTDEERVVEIDLLLDKFMDDRSASHGQNLTVES